MTSRRARSLGRSALIVAIAVMGPASPLESQDAVERLEEGQRVMVWILRDDGVGSARQATGSIAHLTANSLVLQQDQAGTTAEFALAFSDIERLQVHRTKGHSGMGAIIGAVVFGAGGALFGAWADGWGGPFGGVETDSNADGALIYGAFGAAVGAGLGALVGLAVRTADWREVALPEPMVTLSPQLHGQPGLTIRVRLRM